MRNELRGLNVPTYLRRWQRYLGQLEGEAPAAEKLKELLTAATTENAQPARGAQGLIGKQAPSSNLLRRGQLAAALATHSGPTTCSPQTRAR